MKKRSTVSYCYTPIRGTQVEKTNYIKELKSKLKKMNRRKKKKNILFRDVKVVKNTGRKSKKTNKKEEYADVPVVGQRKK